MELFKQTQNRIQLIGDETNKFETSNNKLIEQLTVVRKEKHKKYEEFMETKKIKIISRQR